MNMIVTRPQHDVTTRYLSCWAGEIVEYAKRKGVIVMDLVREKASREEFEGRMKKILPELVFLNGHGSDEAVAGHDNEILIEVGTNEHILSGKTTYAVSCNSGKTLGQHVAQHRGSAYIGYSDEFIFVADGRYISRPSEDPSAKPFMIASNQVMVSILKGHGAQDASNKSKEIFKKQYTELLSSTTDPDALQIAQCLRWDMRHQVCLSNQM